MQISAYESTTTNSGGNYPAYQSAILAKQARRSTANPYTVVRATVHVLGVEITAIVDSGSSNTVMSFATAQKLQMGKHIQNMDTIFWDASGAAAPPVGVVKQVPVQLDKVTMPTDLVISGATNYEILLGSDFMAAVGACINYSTKALEYQIDGATRGSVPIHFGGPDPLPGASVNMYLAINDLLSGTAVDDYTVSSSDPSEMTTAAYDYQVSWYYPDSASDSESDYGEYNAFLYGDSYGNEHYDIPASMPIPEIDEDYLYSRPLYVATPVMVECYAFGSFGSFGSFNSALGATSTGLNSYGNRDSRSPLAYQSWRSTVYRPYRATNRAARGLTRLQRGFSCFGPPDPEPSTPRAAARTTNYFETISRSPFNVELTTNSDDDMPSLASSDSDDDWSDESPGDAYIETDTSDTVPGLSNASLPTIIRDATEESPVDPGTEDPLLTSSSCTSSENYTSRDIHILTRFVCVIT